jgi:protein-arginine kinase activator protein McsA
MPRNLKLTSVNEEELDPPIQDKLKSLNSAKQKAVETEDFDKAKILKEVIDKLKVAGS